MFKNWGKHGGDYNLGKLSLTEVGIAGSIVGLVVSGIYCPVEYVKIQKQLKGGLQTSAFGLLLSEISRTGGKNIFRGYWSTVLREVWGTFFYYGSY